MMVSADIICIAIYGLFPDLRDLLQQLTAPKGMGLHNFKFLLRQPVRLVQNKVRDSDFSNVMHNGRRGNILDFLSGQTGPKTGPLQKHLGQAVNPADMLS